MPHALYSEGEELRERRRPAQFELQGSLVVREHAGHGAGSRLQAQQAFMLRIEIEEQAVADLDGFDGP
jgi:hypothetical protein